MRGAMPLYVELTGRRQVDYEDNGKAGLFWLHGKVSEGPKGDLGREVVVVLTRADAERLREFLVQMAPTLVTVPVEVDAQVAQEVAARTAKSRVIP